MIGIFRQNHDDEAHFTPSVEVAAGKVIQLDDGRAAVNNSLNAIAANTPGIFRTDGVVELEAPSALVLAAGAAVHNDGGVVAAMGGFKVGSLRRGAKVAGQTTIYVALNK